MTTKTRTKKRKLKKKRILIALLVVIVLIAIGGFGVYHVTSNKKEVRAVATVTDEIGNGYNYTITDDATDYSKELFADLKKELSKDQVDEEKYATLETQLFISEFFTLANKINRNDVGGVQFIYADYQESFQKEAMEHLYHYVENDLYGDREQELPEIVNVDVINVEQKEYTLNDTTTDEEAYYVDVTMNYAKDLGYQKSATVVLMHNEKRLDIVKMTEK